MIRIIRQSGFGPNPRSVLLLVVGMHQAAPARFSDNRHVGYNLNSSDAVGGFDRDAVKLPRSAFSD